VDRVFTVGERSSRVRSFETDSLGIPCDGKRLWVCDKNTLAFIPSGEQPALVLPSGEEGKNWSSVMRIIDRALEIPLGRDGTIIALGGGVVCDVAAFAASLYMRGCSLVLIPSTLLAMVDASLGGKTGIDYQDYKNIIGTFYPAGEILIYPALLRTLPETEYRSGLAEVLKHALIEEGTLFDDLEEKRGAVLDRRIAVLNDLIPRSLAVKGRVVEEDPTEQGIRAHLNLGHTFGHALESVLGLGKLPHGHAVAWGIARAMEAGLALGETDPGYARRVRGLFESYGYDLNIRIPDINAYLERISRDKKSRGGSVRFVLQRNIGRSFTRPLEEALLRSVLGPYSS
jgi:3-dehydroquinate synthase